MLTKKYSKNDVLVLKLVSGEEIIARFEKLENGTMTISKALTVQVQQTQQGPALGLAPALMIYDIEHGTLDIREHAIAADTKPPKDNPIVQQYQQSTSGIVTAGANDLPDLSQFGPK